MCQEAGNQQSDFCRTIQHNTDFSVPQINCSPCGQGREPSPACRCVYPITGKLIFRSPSFSGFSNNTNFIMLHQGIADFFRDPSYQVDSVAIRNFRETATGHQLLVDLLLFPLDKESFNQTEMNIAISAFSTHTYNPPPIFGPYIFRADQYRPFSGNYLKRQHTHNLTRSKSGLLIYSDFWPTCRRFHFHKHWHCHRSSSWCRGSCNVVNYSWDLRS